VRILYRLRALARSWFRDRQLDAELDEELRFHLERQTRANAEAGMAPEEARRAAALELGGLPQIRELASEARPGALARQLVRDAGYGARLLRKSKTFAVASVLIVALGSGAVTAVWSVVYGVVLQPLPYPEPERLVSLFTRAPRLGLGRALAGAADARDWREESRSFDELGLVRPIANFNLTGAGEPERLFGARLSASMFRVLRVAPALGRAFAADEELPGRNRVVLLSQALWKRRFAADPGVVGRTIQLSGVPHVVVGVMGPDFRYPGPEFEMWTPLGLNPDELTRKEAPAPYSYLATARLRPGVTLRQAQAELDEIARRLAARYPATNREVGVEVASMLDDASRAVRPALYALLAAAACLLLIACLNLANLLGARAQSRSRELAVRLALGASRGRVALQAVAEVAPILALGGALGTLGAALALSLLLPAARTGLPRADEVSLSAPVLAVSLSMLALTGVAASLVPALQAWRSSSRLELAATGRSAVGGSRQAHARRVLVVAQIALAIPLVAGTGLLLRSLKALAAVDPGFRADRVLSLHLAIPRSKYTDDTQVAAFCTRLLERVAELPGFESAGMVNRLPLGGVPQIGSLEFEDAVNEARLPSADWRSVTPAYFETLGIPLKAGRVFTAADDEAAPPAGIVDEQVAERIWPGQSALGKRFRLPYPGMPWVSVVGVVGHVRGDGLDVDPRPQVYWPYRQRAQDRMALVVRGSWDARAAAASVVRAVRDIDPEQPVYDVRTMEQVVARSLAPRRSSLRLVSCFAGIALVLASVGVYGVVAFGVAARLKEFGLRKALGAERQDLIRLVLKEGVGLATLGTLVGLALAALVGGVLEGLVYGVGARDLPTLAVAGLLLLAVAALASWLPARRAAAVDPAVALRSE
jgi:putative ABC transport system permease protein